MDGYLQEMDIDHRSDRPFRVGIYPVPGFALMSYAATVEPLRAANLLSQRQLYEVIHFDDGVAGVSSGGARIDGAARLGETPALDLFLVIAGGDPFSVRDPRLLQWLARLSRRCPQVGGVSGGPVILARAGLMEGRRMTVHWEHAEALAELFPTLLLERRLYVIDRNRVTCGGGTAPLDLMHALIAGHHGGRFAQLVSDWFLHTGIRAAASPQRSGLAERLGITSGPLLEAVAAMEDNVAEPLSLEALASRAGVTPRQLNRLCRDRLGVSTMAHYRALRLETARRLLETTPLPITEIALATGFSSSAHFSRAYREHTGHPPSRARAG